MRKDRTGCTQPPSLGLRRCLVGGLWAGVLLALPWFTRAQGPPGLYAPHLWDLGDPEGRPDNNLTPTWEETVALFSGLAADHPRWAQWMAIGKDDGGADIHALLLGDFPEGLTGWEALRAQRSGRLRMLVNNGIHPGEPCGVDAGLAWARDLLRRPMDWKDDLVVVIVPMYNVSGSLNRNTCSRANQDGPRAYGFRGNARNLDLNRDFIKMDALNSWAFASLFHAFDPDLFVDTHTTNGADYQHAMTLITTQPDKAGPVLGPFLREVVDPALYEGMAALGFPMAPYVQTQGETPDSGLVGFLETPRYSTGYAVLWGTLGFVSEAHMLKPFPERVAATRAFLEVVAAWGRLEREAIHAVRRAERIRCEAAHTLPVRWSHDPAQADSIPFLGYTAEWPQSGLHSGERLRYNRDQPWSRTLPFYNHWTVAQETPLPEGYILGQAWREVADRLKAQGVELVPFQRDTVLQLEVGYIRKFSSVAVPYEGHHPNAIHEVTWRSESVPVRAGDWWIPSSGRSRRYLAETLSPEGHDAFLVWNFFDSALQQKEWYSSYVFEDTAMELLASDAALRSQWEEAKRQNPSWENDASAALNWLYQHSPYMEPSANRYPVYRMPIPPNQQP